MKKYLSYGLIIIGLIGFLYFSQNQTEEVKNYENLNLQNPITTTTQSQIFYVDIRGEVRFPGVYSIGENEILKSVIDKAGGLTENADISGINQAQLVTKGSLILIPRLITEQFKEDVSTYIYVDIKGEVNKPGVYFIKSNLRLFEAIEIAGGLTQYASVEGLNMSQFVYDGIMITIPRVEERKLLTVYINGEVNRPGFYQVEEFSRLSVILNLAGGLTEKANLELIDFNRIIETGDPIRIEAIKTISKIYVSIKGEILKPDVYYVDENITVIELIKLAGGLTSLANPNLIDFNQVLVLGSVVNIPAINNDDYQPIDNQQGDLININTAILADLTKLKGIGDILGQRIIDYRNLNGRFNTIEEIMFVSGIKQSIYEQIKDNITV